MTEQVKRKRVQFDIQQDFSWQGFRIFPALFGTIHVEDLPHPANDEYNPTPPRRSAA
jgi:hypothetical protein